MRQVSFPVFIQVSWKRTIYLSIYLSVMTDLLSFVSMVLQSASESNLVVLERQARLQEEKKSRVQTSLQTSLNRSRSYLRLKAASERASDLGRKNNVKWSVAMAGVLLCLAWSLGLHISKEDQFQQAVDSFDSFCPKLLKADNTSVVWKDFEYESFRGDWHKVAWLREPDKDDMRCSFVTSSLEAKNMKHLEQISSAGFPKRNFHFLLNGMSKLWVVDTDYKDWAMLYTCSPHFGATTQQAFIVSRKKTLDIVTMGDVLTKWSEYNIPWNDFKIKERHGQCA